MHSGRGWLAPCLLVRVTKKLQTGSSLIAPGMAVTAMLSVQTGIALSTPLLDTIGVTATVWLRLLWAALIFAVIVRPRFSTMSTKALRGAMVLGVATAGLTLLFMAAVDRLPMGTASAIEFLGPLGVAVARSRSLRQLIWPASAVVGVLLLTEPWTGRVDLVGILYALGAAGCWALYILLTQIVGDESEGITGLAVSMMTAAVVATLVAAPGSWDRLTWSAVLICGGIALLVPVLPFTLEFLALRRMTAGAFGTLMSWEPAIAVVIGLVLLGQNPGWLPAVGVFFVVAAGIGAQRNGRRPAATGERPTAAEVAGELPVR